jgi:hypothetical protein
MSKVGANDSESEVLDENVGKVGVLPNSRHKRVEWLSRLTWALNVIEQCSEQDKKSVSVSSMRRKIKYTKTREYILDGALVGNWEVDGRVD